MPLDTSLSRRTLIKASAGAAALGTLGAPAISYAQAEAIKVGHITPRTGFLGPLGEYAAQAAQLAAEEINAAGGIMGRKLELILDDSPNPQQASAKAERLVQRDKIVALLGEISSASALAIAQVVQREKVLFINTGANSDALRGSDCQKFMFHIEAQNSMYVKAVGRSLIRDGLVSGKKWYSLTADYAFGHDLLNVAKRYMAANGGNHAGDDLIPTDLADFSPFLLKIRQARPDVVCLKLPQAVCRVRPDLPGRRLRLRHRARLGRRQGQFRRHLAGRVAPPHRHARFQGLRHRLPEEVEPHAGEPGLG